MVFIIKYFHPHIFGIAYLIYWPLKGINRFNPNQTMYGLDMMDAKASRRELPLTRLPNSLINHQYYNPKLKQIKLSSSVCKSLCLPTLCQINSLIVRLITLVSYLESGRIGRVARSV